MKVNPVIWFEIYVDELSRAKEFYETVFSLKLNELLTPESVDNSMKMLAFPQDMEGLGAGGVLAKMEGVKAGGNSTLVYFGSADCAKEESKIASAGGQVIRSKQSLGEHGFMVLAQDTEGNLFGIHSMQ